MGYINYLTYMGQLPSVEHSALTSIVSFNLPFFPPRELCTIAMIGFLDLCRLLIHKVLVLSLTEGEEQGLQFKVSSL